MIIIIIIINTIIIFIIPNIILGVYFIIVLCIVFPQFNLDLNKSSHSWYTCILQLLSQNKPVCHMEPRLHKHKHIHTHTFFCHIEDNRITEEGTTGGIQSNPAQPLGLWAKTRFLRDLSSWCLITSTMGHGNSLSGPQLQCWTVLAGKIFLPYSRFQFPLFQHVPAASNPPSHHTLLWGPRLHLPHPLACWDGSHPSSQLKQPDRKSVA